MIRSLSRFVIIKNKVTLCIKTSTPYAYTYSLNHVLILIICKMAPAIVTQVLLVILSISKMDCFTTAINFINPFQNSANCGLNLIIYQSATPHNPLLLSSLLSDWLKDEVNIFTSLRISITNLSNENKIHEPTNSSLIKTEPCSRQGFMVSNFHEFSVPIWTHVENGKLIHISEAHSKFLIISTSNPTLLKLSPSLRLIPGNIYFLHVIFTHKTQKSVWFLLSRFSSNHGPTFIRVSDNTLHDKDVWRQ